MTAPTSARQDWLRDLHRRITATKAALDGARAAYQHSPNIDTSRVVGKVERELDWLLDRLPRPDTDR
jgi:hypothetical protein